MPTYTSRKPITNELKEELADAHGLDLDELLQLQSAHLRAMTESEIDEDSLPPPEPEEPPSKESFAPPTTIMVEEEEPQPLPPELLPVDEFQMALMPDALAPYVQECSDLLDCPPDYIVAPLLCSLGSVLGNKIGIQPKQHDPWGVHPNLWGAIVGPPAAMKSPASSAGLRPLENLQRALDSNHAAIQQKVSEQNWRNEHIHKEQEKEAAKQLRADPKAKIDFSFLRESERVVRRQTSLDNTTLEAIHEHLSLAPNNNGVLVTCDELTALLGRMSIPGTGEELRGFFLKGWNGNHSDMVKRIGRGEVKVDRVCISLYGGIQPGKLAPIVAAAMDHGKGDDGLIQRFGLFFYPDLKQNWKCNDRPVNQAALLQATSLMQKAESMSDGTMVRFETDASKKFKKWLETWRGGLNDHHPALQSHFMKYNSLVPQLALLDHFCRASDPAGSPVSMDSLEKALQWVDYLSQHAKRIYHGAGQNDVAAAKRILRKLQDGAIPLDGNGAFSARDVYRPKWSGLTDTKIVIQALDLLDAHGWVEKQGYTLAKGSRSKVLYFPHDAALSLN